jgi:hypothetical protein
MCFLVFELTEFFLSGISLFIQFTPSLSGMDVRVRKIREVRTGLAGFDAVFAENSCKMRYEKFDYTEE